jgi:outer membrane protein
VVRAVLTGFLALLLGAVGAPLSRSQDATPPTDERAVDVILVIDLQRVLREATAVQALQAQVGAAREAFQAEIRQREERLRALDQELARDRQTLSPEAYAQRRQALAEELTALQQAVQERRKQLDQAMTEGMRQVQAALLPIVQTLAEERDADLVLSKTAVALVRPEFEITDAALERLDAALPAVTNMPSN